MNKKLFLVLIITLILLLTGCSGQQKTATDKIKEEQTTQTNSKNKDLTQNDDSPDQEQLKTDQVTEEVKENLMPSDMVANDDKTFISPFTGKPIKEPILQKALMVSIENAPQARPQHGLNQAPIVYEFLVEGGITRFLALYWDEIPDKIGPVRSVRPYLIKTALAYDALLLHAGASPEGFDMLARKKIKHLDQIYHGNYYWRSSARKAPHNLYTGNFKLQAYLNELTGHEYEARFPFQQISFVEPDDIRAKQIIINYWGGYKVCYQYNEIKNQYFRFLGDFENPHQTADGAQISVTNIIVQYVDTNVIDSVGRLSMELNGSGKALIFRDGIVIKGNWEKPDNNLTTYFDEEGNKVELNPGRTWIQVVPISASVSYEE